MRKPLLLLLIGLYCFPAIAQIPPRMDWRYRHGGSNWDVPFDMKYAHDGGLIIVGTTFSSDIHVPDNHGAADAWVLKTDAAGNIQWKKCYGGTASDGGTKILLTPDGGYIIIGYTGSQELPDYHGSNQVSDVWVFKIDGNGTLLWQKCLGGTHIDYGSDIAPASDGGYIITGLTRSTDGDVSGLHGTENDSWIVKLDINGNIEWQKCIGGSAPDEGTLIEPTSDGGYLITSNNESGDGDVPCNQSFSDEVVVAKLDNNGNIQWYHCTAGTIATSISVIPGDGYMITGFSLAVLNGDIDGWLLKLDETGAIEWQKTYGGNGSETISAVQQTSDGGYIVSAFTDSPEIDSCRKKGQADLWLFKIDSNGEMEWNGRYGGPANDYPGSDIRTYGNILLTSDGGYIVSGATASNSGDFRGGIGMMDIWIAKFLFPGDSVLPGITITSDETIICPGGRITFTASNINGGNAPQYQWRVNGADVPVNSNPAVFDFLADNDIVDCMLTSSSPCVTIPTAISNAVSIRTDASLLPREFLPVQKELCNYSTLELQPAGNFSSYLWNTGDTISSLTIAQPGSYWLEVTTDKGCKGHDTTIVTPIVCLKGFYMPTAFTPNRDGLNDVLKPIVAGTLKQFKLSIYNRWGQQVFQTTDPAKGWDGRMKSIALDNQVLIWTCTYQFEGQSVNTEKGTVTLIR